MALELYDRGHLDEDYFQTYLSDRYGFPESAVKRPKNEPGHDPKLALEAEKQKFQQKMAIREMELKERAQREEMELKRKIEEDKMKLEREKIKMQAEMAKKMAEQKSAAAQQKGGADKKPSSETPAPDAAAVPAAEKPPRKKAKTAEKPE